MEDVVNELKVMSRDIQNISRRLREVEDQLKNGRTIDRPEYGSFQSLSAYGSSQRLSPDVEYGKEIHSPALQQIAGDLS